jgi:predicted transcriptional regulator
MKTLTIRLDDELSKRLAQWAKAHDMSQNKAVRRLIRELPENRQPETEATA